MPVTYKPTNVVISPFIRYSGTSAYTTTPAQLTEMIASPVGTALTNQQPVNRDLFNSANSGSISNESIGPEIENIGGHIIRPIIYIVSVN